ncbi:TatD family hydrolase [Pseudoleptotrichia goodfellowii]|uniref:TatD family hydrolase n=1 Tax=Pseudoleptotrichia goodfellowii TaxID=157692 RepID=A0A510J7M6_9FUSO|nr:TatD family hydrolase [Pseudoleptotrichia goodfellowii]BBM35218.1 TatD family hydrolase [Pseudoleptotrichia goodfellowii]
MKIIDTHTHIYDERFEEDFDTVMKNIEEQMEGIVSIGFDPESSKKSIELANKYSFVHAVIGVHPVDIKKYNDEVEKELEKLAFTEKKVVAIGEIGLDYHWMEDPEEVQKEGFRKQIELAERVKLPIVIHTREALQDTLDILREYKNVGGILHCYPGSYEAANPFLDRYYIGVGGTVTFKNNKKTKELVKELSLDKIVLETDCPYLTPVPFRGKRNEPVYTKYVAEEIARIKEISVEEVINITTENAKKIYGI